MKGLWARALPPEEFLLNWGTVRHPALRTHKGHDGVQGEIRLEGYGGAGPSEALKIRRRAPV